MPSGVGYIPLLTSLFYLWFSLSRCSNLFLLPIFAYSFPPIISILEATERTIIPLHRYKHAWKPFIFLLVILFLQKCLLLWNIHQKMQSCKILIYTPQMYLWLSCFHVFLYILDLYLRISPLLGVLHLLFKLSNAIFHFFLFFLFKRIP